MTRRNARRTMASALAALCASAFAAAGASAAQMKPGLWRIESKSEMHGMPVPTGARKHTYERCLSPSQARHPWREMQQATEGECRFSDIRHTGRRVAYRMRCTGRDGRITGHGMAVFEAPTRYHGSSDLQMTAEGMKLTVHTTITGRWLRACSN